MHTPLSDLTQQIEAKLKDLHARDLDETELAIVEILDDVVEVVVELARHRWTKVV